MKIELNKEILNEVHNLVSRFVVKMQNETTSVQALAYCLQVLIEAENDLKEKLESEEDE